MHDELILIVERVGAGDVDVRLGYDLSTSDQKRKKPLGGPDFPYETVQLPQRKQKFFNEPTLFYIWNKQLDNAVTFLSEEIKDLTPVEVPNKYISKGEYFYQIPMDLVTKIKVRIKDEANT